MCNIANKSAERRPHTILILAGLLGIACSEAADPSTPGAGLNTNEEGPTGAGKADANGGWDFCLLHGPCSAAQGDCDSDAECQPGLICRYDVGGNYGWDPYVDVCEAP